MIRFWRRIKFLFQFRKSVPFVIDFFRSREVKVSTKLLAAGFVVGYALFPFDIIPDFLLVLGIVDDVTIATIVLQQIIKIAPRSLREKHELIDE